VNQYQALRPDITTLDIGARDFGVKPFQPDRVLDAVGKALS
jgi:DNA-binding response OmpR family regulator